MATTSSTLWNAVVLRIGKGAQDMLDTGVIVLFGEPVPDALSDICVVHNRGGRSPLTPQRESTTRRCPQLRWHSLHHR